MYLTKLFALQIFNNLTCTLLTVHTEMIHTKVVDLTF